MELQPGNRPDLSLEQSGPRWTRQEQAIQGLRRRQYQRLPWSWATVLTSQWPVLVVQALGQVLNSEIMLVT